LEQSRFLVSAAQRILRFGVLDLLDLEPSFLEELAEVGHRRPPFSREPFALLLMDRDSALERRAKAKVMDIEHARNETDAEALGAAMHDDRFTDPDCVVVEKQLE
jgi:hypothetical protein